MSSENDDNIRRQSRKRCEFLDSDDELQGREENSDTENISLETYYSKGKRKRSFITSDSDHSDDDNESSNDNFNLKLKNRNKRGIIYTDSESDDDSDESSSSEREEGNDDKSESDNLCPICLGEFENQMVAIPENCEHVFCMDCIKEWSKNVNNCPVDRKKFNLIRIKDSNGQFVEEIVIEDVKTNEDRYEDPPTYCQICNECDREDCMLLCDECDNGYHMDCLTPPLECVPIDQWFCIECAPPPKRSRARSTEMCSQTDRQSNRPFIHDESFLDELHERNRHAEGRLLGEFSRTTQARTVASTRTAEAQRRGRGRGSSRGRRGLMRVQQERRVKKVRNVWKSQKKGKKKKKKRNTMKNKISSELEKVRQKIANEEELIRPGRVSLYGDPMYLDELYDPGEEEKEQSPIRSTILSTPDVVGAILGTFDTLSTNVIVSRDGRGTLVPREEPKSTNKKPESNKVDRKRTIRFNAPCDNDDNGDNKDDNACDIIGSILGASDRLHPSILGRDESPKFKIKEEPSECVQLQQKKERNSKSKKRVRTDGNGDGKDDDSDSDNGDAKNDNGINNIRDIEEKGRSHDEPDTGVKIKVEEPECMSWEVDKMTESIDHEFFKEAIEDINVKTEPVDDYLQSKPICKTKNVKPDIIKEEDSDDKNMLLVHMRKRLKETMEKKTKADKLEKECKQMRVASEKIEYKTDSSLLNVASFKIPKLKKENSEKPYAATTKTSNKENTKKAYEATTKASNKENNEKSYTTTTNTNNFPCSRSSVDEYLQHSQRVEGTAKSGAKKRPPLTMLEKKIKLYNDGVLKPSSKKEKKDKRKEEKYGIEESKKKDNKNEEYKKFGDQCENETGRKKTSISLNEYKNRSLCEDLFGDANLDDFNIITKQREDTNSDAVCRNQNLSEVLFGDTNLNESGGDTYLNNNNNNNNNNNINKSSNNNSYCTYIGESSGNTWEGDKETRIRTNLNTVDMYSKYMNPSRNLYNDNEAVLIARTSLYYTPTRSSCTISRPSTNVNLNYSNPKLCTEQGPLGTSSIPSVSEAPCNIKPFEICNNLTCVSEEQTESNLSAFKSKIKVYGYKEPKALEVTEDTVTLSTKCKELNTLRLKKDKMSNKCVSEKIEDSISKVSEGKCKSSTSFELKDNVIKSDSLRSKNDILSTSASSCVSSVESSSLKLKKHIAVHADPVVYKDKSKSQSSEMGNNIINHRTCKVYKQTDKQNTETNETLVTTHLSKEPFSLEKEKSIVTRSIPSVYEKGRSNSLEQKKDTAVPFSSYSCKGKSKSNTDLGTNLSSRACGKQAKSVTSGFKIDKLPVTCKEQHKLDTLAKKDIDYRKLDSSKFEKNSPYSVVRPFIHSSNVLTTQTPVAVISPSFRGNTPEPCFKFKEGKSNESYLQTSLNLNDTPISNHSALRTSAWVLNTSTLTNRKRNSSAFIGTNSAKCAKAVSSTKPTIDTMTNAEKNIIFNTRIGKEINHDLKAKVHKGELDQESIDKIKSYLKPYYKKRMLTKDQWKVVVKSAVRVIHSTPEKFTTDEEIKVLVQKYVSAYLKL